MTNSGNKNHTSKTESLLTSAPLGKKSTYISTYTPSLLFPLPRKSKRDEIGITGALPFYGSDFWRGFEISWLNPKGKPEVAIGEFKFPCESPFLIESKSFKLYLNSFNQSKFESVGHVLSLMREDLSQGAGVPVGVALFSLSLASTEIPALPGINLDQLDVECDQYQPDPSLLKVNGVRTTETLHTHLLKSNCLVTGQPDWGSLQITYTGKQIDHEGLLKYVVSLRDHNEFHEQCVERIFMDIQRQCEPEALTVFARYTRRGGLDISPYRTSVQDRADSDEASRGRLVRQ